MQGSKPTFQWALVESEGQRWAEQLFAPAAQIAAASCTLSNY
jgi:hypothetical protein